MKQNSKLALFDFDGTLTNRDSFIDFLRFAVGKKRFLLGAIALSPVLILYALRILSSERTKLIVLRHFFLKTPYVKLQEIGTNYALNRIDQILRKEAIETVDKHLANGDCVFIVSASPSLWLKAWCDRKNIGLIATELAIDNLGWSGCFATKNCYGIEKVSRIKKQLDLGEFDTIYAYGDSAGDLPMLSLSSHAYFKPFR
ncbi:hydrolase [Campylobacterota bacterium]|nr:hydrolase [Campylobacterota bacterium]